MSEYAYVGPGQNTTTPRTSTAGMLHKTRFDMNKAEERREPVLELYYDLSLQPIYPTTSQMSMQSSLLPTPAVAPAHTLGTMRSYVECV